MTAGTLSGLACARKLWCCCLICSTFCASGFFAAAAFVVVLCETDGAAVADPVVAGLADAAVAGVIVAPAAGVVLAAAAGVVLAVVAAAGVVAAVVGAGVAVVLAAAFVFGETAGLALGDAFAVAAGDFLSFRLLADCCFFSAGVALVAGCSADVSVFGVAAGAVFRVDGAFFSGFVTAGDSAAAGSFAAGASVFGARVVAGFSARGFFAGASFLVGGCDSSGVGCWAITAPASASEQTINSVVIFFMVSLFWSLTEAIYSTPGILPRLERRSP
ncbi:MAG: hypothetical protein ABR611_06565 [Chthoniobacterales bacterium]